MLIAQIVSEANGMLEDARISGDPTEKAQLLAQARQYYGKLLYQEAGFSDAMFGLAEVARMQGSWGEARDRYNEYIATPAAIAQVVSEANGMLEEARIVKVRATMQ